MKRKNKPLFSLIKILVITLLVACTSQGTSTNTGTQQVMLKLNWRHSATFIGFYMAQVQGFYAEEGLEVNIEELSDPALSPNIFNQVLTGEYEFGISGPNLANAQAEGLALTEIGSIYKLNPGAFFSRKGLGIHSPADFKGRTVVVKGLGWQNILENILATANLTLDDVELIPGGFDMTPFYEGEVEIWAGFITEEVVRVRLQGIEVTTLPLFEYDIRGGSVNIYTSQTLLMNDQDLAVRFLRASLRGWQFAIENPSQSVTEMLALFPDLEDGFEYVLASFEASIPLIIPSGSKLGAVDCEEWTSNRLFEGLESTDKFCASDVYLSAVPIIE